VYICIYVRTCVCTYIFLYNIEITSSSVPNYYLKKFTHRIPARNFLSRTYFGGRYISNKPHRNVKRYMNWGIPDPELPSLNIAYVKMCLFCVFILTNITPFVRNVPLSFFIRNCNIQHLQCQTRNKNMDCMCVPCYMLHRTSF
jgi:hypothetical protein